MLRLTPDQVAALRDWFLPERPGPLVGLHVLQTGHGRFLADRWPDPEVLLAESGGNYALVGDPAPLDPADLVGCVAGFVDAPERFVPRLQAAFPDLVVWERVILALPGRPPGASGHHQLVRRLDAADADHLRGFTPESAWISKTWGGPAGLAASGHAWGAFVEGRLASVACSFFVGARYEDIGVVTEPEFRGLGLSAACAGALCVDIQARGRTPSWTTSPDNLASLRVAEKLGFALQRHDRLYVVGIPVPAPARRPDA